MMPHAQAVLEYLPVLLSEVFFRELWQGLATALAVAAMLRMFPRAGAEARYTVMRVAFVLLAVLPWVHFDGAALPQAAASAAVRIGPVVATVLAVIWAVMATVRTVQLLRAYRHLRAVWRRAIPLMTGGEDGPPFVFGKGEVEVCTSADVDSPTVLGFRRPRLLLPEWLLPTLTDADLEQIALHEGEHLRRRDEWMNLLQQLALILSPLHPALFWLNGRLNVQRELACDAGVIARTAEPIAYANCLTRLAEQRLERRKRLRLALAAWERRSELAKRVHALLSGGAVTWTPVQSRFAAAAMTLVFAAGALAMARAPELIRVGGQVRTAAAVTMGAPATLFPRDPARSAVMRPVVYRAPANDPLLEPRGIAARQRKSVAVLPVRAERKKSAVLRRGLLLTGSAQSAHAPGTALRPVRLVTTEFTYAYAAVPFGDGWLFLQL